MIESTHTAEDASGQTCPNCAKTRAMFPNAAKLVDLRLLCNFADFLKRRGLLLLAVSGQGEIGDLGDEMMAFVGIDRAQLDEERRQLDVLIHGAAQKGTGVTHEIN